jgi:hypothetical protein
MGAGIRGCCWGLMICLVLSLAGGGVRADEVKKVRGEFGIMFGFLDGMALDVYDKDSGHKVSSIDTDMGLSGGASFDQGIYRSLWVGVTIDLFQVRKSVGMFGDVSARVLNPSLRLSFHQRQVGSLWSFRPGVACGVALVEEIFGYKASQYVTLRPFLQTVCHLTNKTGLLFEISEFQTLQGGNDNYDIEAGPAWGFRVGLLK